MLLSCFYQGRLDSSLVGSEQRFFLIKQASIFLVSHSRFISLDCLFDALMALVDICLYCRQLATFSRSERHGSIQVDSDFLEIFHHIVKRNESRYCICVSEIGRHKNAVDLGIAKKSQTNQPCGRRSNQ